MRGVILAGGKGTRLKPFTEVTNKHLALVHEKLMIEYPLETLKQFGLEDILIIVGGEEEHGSAVINYLGAGERYNVNLNYKIQKNAGGIADALRLAEDFSHNENIAVILGDNFFDCDLSKEARNFTNGAKIFLKEVPDPERFGVAEVKDDKVIGIEEKPKTPKTNLAVTGLYFYDPSVFEIIPSLKPSARGELEITDVNNAYIQKSNLFYSVLEGFWSDMGTIVSRRRSDLYLAIRTQKQI